MYEFDPVTTAQLACRLRNGDSTVIEALVHCHIPLANLFARKYGGTNLALREELYACALSSLFLGIQKAQTRLTDDNITTYLYKWLSRAVMREWWNLHHTLSHDTVTRTDDGRVNRDIAKHSYDELFHQPTGPPLRSPYNVAVNSELLARIRSLARNERERDVIQLIYEGCSDIEIGEHIGITRKAVNKMRERFKLRYVDIFGYPYDRPYR